MKKLFALSAVAVLASLGVAYAQPTETELVQELDFNLTALSQGPTTTNKAGTTASTITRSSITSTDVINWIGSATGTTFSNAALMVITPLTPGDGGTTIVIRQTVNGETADTDVTAFFSRLAGDVSVNRSTVNGKTGAVNGTFDALDGFTLQDAMGFTLPGHFTVSGFNDTEVSTAVNKKGQITGTTENGVIEGASGTGDVGGTPALFRGRVSLSGSTVVVQSSPGV